MPPALKPSISTHMSCVLCDAIMTWGVGFVAVAHNASSRMVKCICSYPLACRFGTLTMGRRRTLPAAQASAADDTGACPLSSCLVMLQFQPFAAGRRRVCASCHATHWSKVEPRMNLRHSIGTLHVGIMRAVLYRYYPLWLKGCG